MKNYKKGFAPLIIILVGVVLIGGGVFVYSKNNAVTPEQKIAAEKARVTALFPQTLGDYELVERNLSKVRIEERDCQLVQDGGDSKATGLSGEICWKTFRAEYEQKNSNKVIFVDLNTVLSNKELFLQVVAFFATPDTLDGHSVVRMETPEIGWMPKSDFDFIRTQEGTRKVEANGDMSMSYTQKASGNNPVTQYFLRTYPPAPLSETASKPVTSKDEKKDFGPAIPKVVSAVSIGAGQPDESLLKGDPHEFKISQRDGDFTEFTVNNTRIFLKAVEAHEDTDTNFVPYSKEVCSRDRSWCQDSKDWIIVSVNGKDIEFGREEIKQITFNNGLKINMVVADIEGASSNYYGSDGGFVVVK
jgi:hypothetical protein